MIKWETVCVCKNRFNEALLMSTHYLCLSSYNENTRIFHMKYIYSVMQEGHILHGWNYVIFCNVIKSVSVCMQRSFDARKEYNKAIFSWVNLSIMLSSQYRSICKVLWRPYFSWEKIRNFSVMLLSQYRSVCKVLLMQERNARRPYFHGRKYVITR